MSFGNEPNITVYGSSNPATYTAEDYRRDVQAFLALRAEVAPDSRFIGPGSFFTTGAERPIAGVALGPDTSAIMPLTGGLYDAVSYHHYPAFGNTDLCSALQPRPPTDPLAAEFLDRVQGSLAYMRGLRDTNAPGRSLWVDEFGNTACGGVIGYSNTLAASFYYLNALGTMARGGVRVATRWTISGPQPYALIDDATLTPRPDYWAALLWKRLMGTTVLDPAVTGAPAGLRVFSSCTPDVRGGVTTLALNTDRAAPASLSLAANTSRGAGVYAVTGDLAAASVALNGRPLEPSVAGELPSLSPAPATRSTVTVAPASYAFITQPRAHAPACGAPPRRLAVSVDAPRQGVPALILRRAIASRCGLEAAGHCSVRAWLSRAQARSIGLAAPAGGGRVLIATGHADLPAAGVTPVSLALRPGVIWALLLHPRASLHVKLRAEGTAPGRRPGNASATLDLSR